MIGLMLQRIGILEQRATTTSPAVSNALLLSSVDELDAPSRLLLSGDRQMTGTDALLLSGDMANG